MARKAQPDRPVTFSDDIRRIKRVGYVSLAVFLSTVGVWGAFASVSNAVIASGQFVADSNVKKVQHQTGGVVGAIMAHDGDKVRKGDLLLRLDDTVLKANLQIITSQIDEMLVRSSRLEAERDQLAELAISPAMASRLAESTIAAMMANERRLFEARRSARDGVRAQLEKRVQQSHAEIEGLVEQRRSKEQQSGMIERELVGVRGLYLRNLVQITRLSQLEREASSLAGQSGQLTAAIAQSEGKIAETRLQILQQTEELRADAMKELRDIQLRLAELKERRIAAEDQLQRVEIRAPVSGIVHQSNAHTVGGVIPATEPAMLIVPGDDLLALEVRIPPQEIDQIFIGQTAIVKLHAFNQRTTPEFSGTVTRVGSDVVRDQQSGASFYIARLKLTPDSLKEAGALTILPGMQAEAFIDAGARSPYEYLARPIKDQFSRAFRER